MSETTCRTCGRTITFDTRTEPGFLPREGWRDDSPRDPLVCFRAVNFRHEPAVPVGAQR